MLVLLLAGLCAAGVVGVGVPPATAGGRGALANLGHLDFLGDRVGPPEQAGHTTWRLDQDPEIGVLWTYAEPQPDGSYRRLGAAPTTRRPTPGGRGRSTPTT